MARKAAPRSTSIKPLRCPRRHSDWETRQSRGDYYCNSCGEHFEELLDMREVGA